MHNCDVVHDDNMGLILDYVAAYYLEKELGAHVLCERCKQNEPCGSCCVRCKVDYHPPSSAWITRERREAIKQRDQYRCVYCTADLRDAPKSHQTLEHLISLEEYAHIPHELKIFFGSRHKTANIALACRTCNSRRRGDWCTYARSFHQATERIESIISDRQPLAIEFAKQVVGNKRSTYRNAWITRQRLSQGEGTIGA